MSSPIPTTVKTVCLDLPPKFAGAITGPVLRSPPGLAKRMLSLYFSPYFSKTISRQRPFRQPPNTLPCLDLPAKFAGAITDPVPQKPSYLAEYTLSPHFPLHFFKIVSHQCPSPHLHQHGQHCPFTLPRPPNRAVRNGRGQNASPSDTRRHSTAPHQHPPTSPSQEAVPTTDRKKGFLGGPRIRAVPPTGG